MFDLIRSSLNHRQIISIDSLSRFFSSIFSPKFSFVKLISSVVVVFQFLGLFLFNTPVTPYGAEIDLSEYTLVFEDEFEGTELDTTVWQHRALGKRRGGYNGASQVKVENGNLTITGEYLEDGKYGAGWYAGMISLKERYNQGYYEIRCICNKDQGYWSAFWMQSNNAYIPDKSLGGIGGAEIDIFEAMSYGDGIYHNSVIQTIHCSGMEGDTSGGLNSARLGYYYGNDIYNQFNTYGLEWTEDEYIFYVNGVETARTSWADGVSQDMQEVIVSLELPSDIEDYGYDKETYKTELIVDYVKIYQK